MMSEESKEKIKDFFVEINFLGVLIPIIGIIVTNFQLWEIMKNKNGSTNRFIIFYVILNLVIISFSFIVYQKVKDKNKMKEEIDILEKRVESLTELTDSIRCFKHDFYNIIQAIEGYITMNNMAGLEEYFSKLMEECEYTNKLELLVAKSIKDPAIYGVLLDKFKKAEKENVKMNIDALADFNIVSDKSYLISRVFGILLDNAIEAAADCNEKFINVRFTENENDAVKQILVENTYKNKNVDVARIYEKEFSSKKEKGNKGLGLWKVRELLRKESKIYLLTNKDDVMFKQELKITV